MERIDPLDICAGRGSAVSSSTLGGAPEMHRRPLDPRLDGLVTDIVDYREHGRALRLSPEMAPLIVPLVISFAEPFEIALGRTPGRDDRYWSFTSGLYPGFVLINSAGGAECVQIDFTPPGAFRFFGLPMSEIAGRMVTLDELVDSGIAELRRRLADAPTWRHRLDIAETFVLDRLLASEPGDPAVEWAFGAILARRGHMRVGDLAHRLGWSRKHLNARFRDEIGIGPKAVARMMRFNRALALARRGGGWADIAAECGYADQAHLVREFREFAGRPPASLLAGRP